MGGARKDVGVCLVLLVFSILPPSCICSVHQNIRVFVVVRAFRQNVVDSHPHADLAVLAQLLHTERTCFVHSSSANMEMSVMQYRLRVEIARSGSATRPALADKCCQS